MLPDLYLPKMKNALFVAPVPNGLVLCNVHISSHPLNKQQEQITLILSFEWRAPGPHCVAMEMSQGKYHETLS